MVRKTRLKRKRKIRKNLRRQRGGEMMDENGNIIDENSPDYPDEYSLDFPVPSEVKAAAAEALYFILFEFNEKLLDKDEDGERINIDYLKNLTGRYSLDNMIRKYLYDSPITSGWGGLPVAKVNDPDSIKELLWKQRFEIIEDFIGHYTSKKHLGTEIYTPFPLPSIPTDNSVFNELDDYEDAKKARKDLKSTSTDSPPGSPLQSPRTMSPVPALPDDLLSATELRNRYGLEKKENKEKRYTWPSWGAIMGSNPPKQEPTEGLRRRHTRGGTKRKRRKSCKTKRKPKNTKRNTKRRPKRSRKIKKTKKRTKIK